MYKPTIELVRLNDTGFETFGVLIFNNHPVCATLELPWKNNQRMISCIPQGEYLCTPEPNHSKGFVWRVRDVPKRSGILIHSGNRASELRGCIAPGMKFEQEDWIGVKESRDAIATLSRLLNASSFNLRVRAFS